jgi:hypothetical protein
MLTVLGEELDSCREEGEVRVETVPREQGEGDSGIPGKGSGWPWGYGVEHRVEAVEAKIIPSFTSGSFPLSPLLLSSLPPFFDPFLFLLLLSFLFLPFF